MTRRLVSGGMGYRTLYSRVCLRIAQDPHGHEGLPVDKCDGQQRRTMEKWLRNGTLIKLKKVRHQLFKLQFGN